MENSCPLQPKQKLFKEQRNQSRKQDLKPVNQTDGQTETGKSQLADGHKEDDKRRPIVSQHVVEVDIEIVRNIGLGDVQKTLSHPVKPCSKHNSTTPQKVRRKLHANVAAGVPSPKPGSSTPTSTVPSSPSQASIISDTAVEELCDLRNYYSKQLKRINYISHEYLGQPAETGVLACIREPLKSLRLPRRMTITQTARSLWARVSGRRKLLHR